MKKEFAADLIKKILTALHEKRFADVITLVDESTLNEEELVEFIQGTVKLNKCKCIDCFKEKNIAYVSKEDKDPFEIVYHLGACGKEMPLVLRLEVLFGEDGFHMTRLDIEPN